MDHEVQVAALLAHVRDDVDEESLQWPGGWPNEIEAALIDAVYSIRARYGGPDTGVRRVVQRWRKHRGVSADDLRALATTDPAEVATIVGNDAEASGRPKSAVVVQAAAALDAVGLRHAADYDGSENQRRAYTRTHGCGPVTWAYLGMLLGRPGVKADTWIMRYVTAAVKEPVSPEVAQRLLTAAASDLGVTPSQLDHAIWQFARSSGRPYASPGRAQPGRRRTLAGRLQRPQ